MQKGFPMKDSSAVQTIACGSRIIVASCPGPGWEIYARMRFNILAERKVFPRSTQTLRHTGLGGRTIITEMLKPKPEPEETIWRERLFSKYTILPNGPRGTNSGMLFLDFFTHTHFGWLVFGRLDEDLRCPNPNNPTWRFWGVNWGIERQSTMQIAIGDL